MSYTTSSGQKAALPLQGLDSRVLVLIGVHRGRLVGRRLAVVEPCKHAVHLPAAEFFTGSPPKSPKAPQHLEALHRFSAAQCRERTAGRLAQAMLGCFLQAPSPKRPSEGTRGIPIPKEAPRREAVAPGSSEPAGCWC